MYGSGQEVLVLERMVWVIDCGEQHEKRHPQFHTQGCPVAFELSSHQIVEQNAACVMYWVDTIVRSHSITC